MRPHKTKAQIDPMAHNRMVTFFTGVAKNANPAVAQDLQDLANQGDYQGAHNVALDNNLYDPKNPIGRNETLDHGAILRGIQNKQRDETNINNNPEIRQQNRQQSSRGAKVINPEENDLPTQYAASFRARQSSRFQKTEVHPAAKRAPLSDKAVAALKDQDWDKIPDADLRKITMSVARHGFGGRPVDSSDFVDAAREKKQDDAIKALKLLRYGVQKALVGSNRDPESQRKQDMNTQFFRRPKTHRSGHRHHQAILRYFDYYSKPLRPESRNTIMHDASIGEYGSAQRKLARRNDGLPAGLDGLKFGDLQVETILEMIKEGIF